MKTPITYYGGKTNMLRHILPLIPEDHRIYVEPFVGGGAVLFAKQPAKVEVINDNLDCCITFYRVAKLQFNELQRLIETTLHAESEKIRSRNILKNQDQFSELEIAWAFWIQNNLSFAHKMFGGFAFAKEPLATTTANKINLITNQIADRLRHIQIFNRDALDVIRKFDSRETFFYLDPPYPNSDCGHYARGKEIFYELLELLPNLQGRWLLSSYPGDELDRLRRLPGINFTDIGQPITAGGVNTRKKRKTECLTWNYNISQI